MANQINFQLTTSTDLKGVRELKKELQDIRNLTTEASLGNNFLAGETEQIQKIINDVDILEYALENAFNPKINAINIEKFNKTLKESNTDIAKLSKTLMSAGSDGQKAFLSLNNSLMQMGTATKQTNKFLDEMATTFKNSIKWGISSAVWNNMVGGAEQAYGYVKKLDSSLNDIRIVTGKSAEEMKKFAESANNAAKELGTATTDYTKGSTIYYQQGLDDKTTAALTEVTAKASNVTGQSMEEVSEQLTAVWNGYQVANEAAEKGMGIYEEYVDKMAAVGAATASDLEELATAMSKVASAANSMGIDFDQLNAQIATIVSVTRQAPESVGTALKTIYARMGDLKVDGVDEFGTSLGEVSGTLEQVGIKVTDAQGNLRDMGPVIEEVAGKWGTWTEAQRQAIAVAMAGKRQYNNLIALFDNWNMYEDTLGVAQNATGTLQEQQDIYLDSTNAKLETLNATFEDLFDSLLDTNDINGFIEGLTAVVQLFADLADSLGGLHNILPMIGAIGLRTFKDQIGEGIQKSVTNSKNLNTELEIQRKNEEILRKGNIANKEDEDKLPSLAKERLEDSRGLYDEIHNFNISLTKEQKEQVNNIINANTELAKMSVDYEDQIADLKSSSEYFRILNDNLEEQELTSKNINEILKERNKITSDLIQASKTLNEDSSETFENKTFHVTSGKISNLKERSITNTENYQEAFGINQDTKENRNMLDVIQNSFLKETSVDDNAFEGLMNKTNTFIEGLGGNTEKLKKYFKDLKDVILEVNTNTDTFIEALGEPGIEIASEFIEPLSEDFRKLSLQGKDTSEILEILSNKLAEAGMESSKIEEALKKIGNEAPRVKNGMDSISESLQLQNAIANITNVVGAVGQLVNAFQTFKNIGDIWSNQDLSVGEKLQQTVMNLAISLPILINAYNTLKKSNILNSIQTIKTIKENEKLSKSENNVKNSTEETTKAIQKQNKALDENTKKKRENTNSKINKDKPKIDIDIDKNGSNKTNAVENLDNLKDGAEIVDGIIEDLPKKGSKNFKLFSKGAEGVSKSVGKIGTSVAKVGTSIGGLLKGLLGAISKFLGPITIIMAAFEVADAIYKGIMAAELESVTRTTEANQELLNSYKEQKEAIESIESSISSLSEQYRNGTIALSDYREELNKIYKEQGLIEEANAVLHAQNEEEIEQIQSKAKIKNSENIKTQAGTTKDSYIKQFSTAMEADTSFVKDIIPSMKSFLGDNDYDHDLKGFSISIGNYAETMRRNLNTYGDIFANDGKSDNMNIQAFAEAYAKHSEEIDNILANNNSANAKALKEWISENQEVIEGMKQAAEDERQAALDLESEKIKSSGVIEGRKGKKEINLEEDIKSLEDYNKAVEQYARGLMWDEQGNPTGNFESLAEATEFAKQALSGYNDELAEFQNKEDSIQGFLDVFNQENPEASEEEQKAYEEKVRTALEGLDSDEIGYIPLDFDFDNASAEELNNAIEEARRKAQVERVEVGISLGTDAVNKLLSGEQIDESTAKALEQQYSQIKGLEEESEQLAAIRDKNSRAYLDKILEINQKLEQLRTNNAVEDFNEVLGNIDVKADTDVFMEQMDALTEADYEVSVAVKADMDSDFDQISGILDNIEDYSGKIGENFIVAAKDVEELNDAFPGILDQCEYLADGTIQLNQAVVQNAMDGAKAEAQASVEAAASKMEAEAQVFLSKAQIYNNLADIAHQAATTEMDQEDIKSQFSAQLEELERINNEETSQQEMDNAFSVAENSADNATATGQNWIDAYKSAADASTAFAKTAASNNAAAEGKDPGAAVTYSGPTSVSGASNTGAQGSVSPRRAVETGTATREQYSQYEESARAQAQALTQSANNLIGMATELRARGNGVSNLTNNIGSGRGSSGRSGGGSSSNREVKELDNSLPDYYKQLEQVLETVNNQLSLLQERQEHLSGKALIKNIEKQTAAYVKQAAVLERLNKTAAVDVATLRSQGSKYSNISYDTDGNITQESYEAEFAAQQAAYNAAVQRYNASAQTDADKAALKAAEESWKNFQDWIDNYDEAISKVEDYLNQLQEVIQSVADSNLNKFDVTFDVKLDTQELNRSWLQFQQKYQKDFKKTAKTTAKDIQNLVDLAKTYKESFNIEQNRFKDIESQAEKMTSIFSQYTNGKGQVSSDDVDELINALKEEGIQYTTIADLQKDLQESFESLQDYAEQLFDALQQGWSDYLSSIDEIISHMDELMSTYDKLSKKNEYYLRVAELTAGVYDKTKSKAQALKEAQEQYYKTTVKNSESQLRALKNQKQAYQDMLNAVIAQHKEEGKTDAEISLMDDYIKIKKALEGVEDQYQDVTIAALEAADALKEMAKQEAFDNLEKSLTGTYGSFEKMNQEWEDAMRLQDRYYDSTERLYELDSLGLKYDNGIKSSSLSLENQKKLNALKEKELKYLRDKEKLTKDDIALANQRYNIAMAEMALEEAQNNKNTMKVTRNAEGNWSYQYVADEGDIQDKEQSLKEEYHELYEMAKGAYQNSLQLAMELKQEYFERYKEIIENEKLTEEEKITAIKELNQEYSDFIKEVYDEAAQYYVDVNGSSAEIIYGYYKDNLTRYDELSNEEKDIVNAVKESKINSYDEVRDACLDANSEIALAENNYNQESIAGWQDTNEQREQMIQAITQTSLDSINIIEDAQEEYKETCDTVSELVGEDWNNMGELMAATEEDARTAEQAITDYGREAVDQINEEIDSLQELEQMWGEVQQAIESCKEALDNMAQAAETGIQQIVQAAQQAQQEMQQTANSANGSVSGSGSSGGGGGGSTGTHSITVTPVSPSAYVVYDNTAKKRTTGDTPGSAASKDWIIRNYGKFGTGTYNVTKWLDTGGYTGEWAGGSERANGRLAFLHQKELVLNEHDTANFLEAIDMIRDVAGVTSSISNSIMSGIANMICKMLTASNQSSNYNNSTIASEPSSTSSVYNINAEFPNATDKDSILEAFESLPNIASQKVNNKLR